MRYFIGCLSVSFTWLDKAEQTPTNHQPQRRLLSFVRHAMPSLG